MLLSGSAPYKLANSAIRVGCNALNCGQVSAGLACQTKCVCRTLREKKELKIGTHVLIYVERLAGSFRQYSNAWQVTD